MKEKKSPSHILKILLNYIKTKKGGNKIVFTNIYEQNIWACDESASGSGSTLQQTQVLRQALENVFVKYNITSVLDIPCGDFNWMQHVNMQNIQYIGADIVPSLIKLNKQKYTIHKRRTFKKLDLTRDKLPNSDIIIVRDCFVHLSFEDIFHAVRNIKASKSKYLLTTTFTNRKINEDSSNGGWRTLNLQIAPFNFPSPIEIINEEGTEDNGSHADKTMALYYISEM